MRTIDSRPLVSLFLLFVSLIAVTSCQRATETATPPQPPYNTDATIKDLMLNVVDVQADVVWLSVTTVASEKGLEETRPSNDDEWAAVRHGAMNLAEAANLLMMPGRRVADAGHKSEVPGIELETEEMEKLINNSRGVWEVRAKALHDAAMQTYRAAEAKDADKVFELGETIEMACENCHKQYWYPNEKIPELPQ